MQIKAKKLFESNENLTAYKLQIICYIFINRSPLPYSELDFSTRDGLAQLKDALCQLTDILAKEKGRNRTENHRKNKEKKMFPELIDKCLQQRWFRIK